MNTPLFLLLLLFPLVSPQDDNLSLHIPSLKLKSDDILGFNFQAQGQDFITFSVKLQTGCYLSKNFYYTQPTHQTIRLIHHITITLTDVDCPLDFTDNRLNDVAGITTKHSQFALFSNFENRDLAYEIYYGVIDYKNKSSSAFAIVGVTTIPQKPKLLKNWGFGINFICLLSIFDQ